MTTSERFKKNQPIEVWATDDRTWVWEVFRKYQKPEKEAENPYAIWHCRVSSPFVGSAPNGGEIGDVYVSDIKKQAKMILKVGDITRVAKTAKRRMA